MSRQNRNIAVIAGAAVLLATGGAMFATRDAAPPEPQTQREAAPNPSGSIATVQSAAQSQDQTAPITRDTDHLTFSATFPDDEALRSVASALRTETNTYLQRLEADARESSSTAMPQWEVNIQWRPISSAGGFASLIGRSLEYRGGAHPVQLVDTKLMRIADGEEIQQADMFTGRYWPTPAVTIAVCEELKTAKSANIGSATIFDEPIVCAGPRNNIKLDEAKFAFAASRTGDTFGGIHVFYQPYVVGSYAEGAYELTIPAEVFQGDLKKEYATLFSGDPLPLDD